jgi:hypothetical protein
MDDLPIRTVTENAIRAERSPYLSIAQVVAALDIPCMEALD